MMSLPANDLKGAVAQMTSAEDVSENLQQCLSLLSQIESPKDLDLVCFPENSLFFRIGREMKSVTLGDEVWEPLLEFSQAHNIHIVMGALPLLEGSTVYNSTVHLAPGEKPRSVYRKIHLFDVDVDGQKPIRESDQFAPGQELSVLEVNGWRFGLSICYDLRFSELYSQYLQYNVHGFMVPSAFLVPTGKAHWHCLLRARAIESQVYVLAAAQGGQHMGVGKVRRTFGHSLVIDPWGDVMAEAQSDGPEVLYFNLRAEKIRQVSRQIPMTHHRRL